jgi:cytidylate kinase
MNKKIIIAIDGYSSTGKTTLAKMLSTHLNYQHINTGAMYRAVTLNAIRKNWIIDSVGAQGINKDLILKSLDSLQFEFIYNENQSYQLHLNKENIDKYIKDPLVAKYVSFVSTFPELRKKIVSIQQEMGKNGGIVMEGRDIGSVVFPSAELKLFITASVEIRAQRRYEELLNMGVKTNLGEVLKNLEMRDFQDSNRKKSPLIQVEDAVLIDNTSLSVIEQCDYILNLLKNKFNIL